MYTNLVEALDIMQHTGQKKYWLDIRQLPTTLYAITDQPSHRKPALVFSCGTRYAHLDALPRTRGFQQMLAEFWRQLLALADQPWQTLALWLVLIGCLSLGRLIQPKFGRHNF